MLRQALEHRDYTYSGLQSPYMKNRLTNDMVLLALILGYSISTAVDIVLSYKVCLFQLEHCLLQLLSLSSTCQNFRTVRTLTSWHLASKQLCCQGLPCVARFLIVSGMRHDHGQTWAKWHSSGLVIYSSFLFLLLTSARRAALAWCVESSVTSVSWACS